MKISTPQCPKAYRERLCNNCNINDLQAFVFVLLIFQNSYIKLCVTRYPVPTTRVFHHAYINCMLFTDFVSISYWWARKQHIYKIASKQNSCIWNRGKIAEGLMNYHNRLKVSFGLPCYNLAIVVIMCLGYTELDHFWTV